MKRRGGGMIMECVRPYVAESYLKTYKSFDLCLYATSTTEGRNVSADVYFQ